MTDTTSENDIRQLESASKLMKTNVASYKQLVIEEQTPMDQEFIDTMQSLGTLLVEALTLYRQLVIKNGKVK